VNIAAEMHDRLAALAFRGITLAIAPSGALHVRPASLLTGDDRAWLRIHAAPVVAHLSHAAASADITQLSGNEPWDSRVALALMRAADAMVEHLGVDGRRPEIRAAAALVGSAFAAHDLETVRFACSEFGVVVRAVAARRSGGKPGNRS